jgi:hypothetical protein
MNEKDLADEIRGAGMALRYADGPVIGTITERGRRQMLHSVPRKLRLPDSEIIRMAATCSTCDAGASSFDIEFARDVADCYRSFARLIWPSINHEQGCPAQPYLPVSEVSKKVFSKLKARFEDLQRRRLEEAASVRSPFPKKKASTKKAKSSRGDSVKKRATKKSATKPTKKSVKKAEKKPIKKKSPRKKRG